MWTHRPTAAQIFFTHEKKVLNPFSVSHCPLCNRMIKYDISTSASCFLSQDWRSLSQCTHSLFCRSVRLTLFDCCHSCWHAKSSCSNVYKFSQKIFLITVHWHVSVKRLLYLQKLLEIFKICSLSTNGFCKRFSTWSSTDQDLDCSRVPAVTALGTSPASSSVGRP